MPTTRSGLAAPRLVSFVVRAATGLIMLAAAVGLFRYLAATRPEPPQAGAPPAPPAVRAVVCSREPVRRVWEGYGTLRTLAAADVAAEVAATIVDRPAEIEAGAAVEAGDVILRLDPTDFQSRAEAARQAVASGEADLAAWEIELPRLAERARLADQEASLREAEYRRMADALEQGAGNAVEVERALTVASRARRESIEVAQSLELMDPRRSRAIARLESDRAALRLAEEELRRTTIRAPISGTLQWVEGRPGERVGVGRAVARVVDLSRLEAPIRLPASATPMVGQPAELELDTASGRTWSGVVARLAPEADAATRTITAYVGVTPEGGLPRPGQFVIGRVRSEAAEPRVIVPRRALDGEGVLVADRAGSPGPVRRVSVRVAFVLEGRFPAIDPGETEWAVIDAGLEGGELVIVSNLDELRPGAIVVADTGGAAPPGPAGGPGGGGR